MKLKQKPEDFVVREAHRFDESKRGEYYVYRMDKQKLSTFEAIDRIARHHKLATREFSFCGLKDKQGRTEQLIAVRGMRVSMQAPDLRLEFLGRTDAPLSAANLTANRFVVTVRDLSIEEAERVPASVNEVRAAGLVNYFDSQRFGGVKHGQGFLGKDLATGRIEHALRGYLAKPSPLDRSEDAKVKAFWAKNWGDWTARCPYPRAAHYRPVLSRLRKDPRDFVRAFMAIEPRYRGLLLFEYQSYLWNESVRRYLLGRLGTEGHLVLRYQAGRLLFPRAVPDRKRREALHRMDFPLVGPDSKFDDPEVEKAVADTLAREKIRLAQLGLPDVPGMGMKHEDRPLLVVPPRLSVVDPRPDELQPGRLKITLAFTLPPGAYATLLVKRTLWFATRDAVESGGPLPEPTSDFVPERVLERMATAQSRAQGRRNRRPRPSHGIASEEAAGRRGRRDAGKSPPRSTGGTGKRAGKSPRRGPGKAR
jgi:tRNA pseudouridine13 synthase